MNGQDKIVITDNAWEGFQGMYSYYNECESIGIYYKINGLFYSASSLDEEEVDENSYHSGCDLMDSFVIDKNGSEILLLPTTQGPLLYQRLLDKTFIKLLPTDHGETSVELEGPVYTLKVPLPNGQDIDGVFEELVLTPIEDEFIKKFEDYMYDEEKQEQRKVKESEILTILNSL
jgi:hypothetical protein